jgi:aspartate-semialdehyde dehydrogenase
MCLDALILREETFGQLLRLRLLIPDRWLPVPMTPNTGWSYLHSDDSRRIYRVSRALQFGMVAVNRAQVWVRQFHGGTKQSA